ncbi:GntR family transcriptional regulator [Sandaracinobacteroides saxicola]|uniref:GntR family transcriptional regulator n=1 Tax=Sandaracinobacteroides saxicola TaxID=2759707 RepID=A0A7G5IJA4_9SPHN|nr:GntR family transcriptional regulator [Sandaracinobacteroides saxicola]QMW23446.1 GntR family transcriptional regulator [Sandaracinobacteroides saxicola]
MPHRRPAEPRYARLAAQLRDEIRGGHLRPGDPVPTESALTDRFGLSRFTVRAALKQLQDEGLITRRRGSGTVIADDTPALRQSFSDLREILQYAASSSFLIQDRGGIRLSPAQARDLRRPAGEAWHHVTGVRRMAGATEAMALTDVFIHPRLSAHVPHLASGHETLFSQLQRLAGVRVATITQELQAVAATPAQAALLHIPRRAPCLRILRLYRDPDGEIFEMSSSVHPGDRYSYAVQIDGQETTP